jgi:hypothetical protein
MQDASTYRDVLKCLQRAGADIHHVETMRMILQGQWTSEIQKAKCRHFMRIYATGISLQEALEQCGCKDW